MFVQGTVYYKLLLWWYFYYTLYQHYVFTRKFCQLASTSMIPPGSNRVHLDNIGTTTTTRNLTKNLRVAAWKNAWDNFCAGVSWPKMRESHARYMRLGMSVSVELTPKPSPDKWDTATVLPYPGQEPHPHLGLGPRPPGLTMRPFGPCPGGRNFALGVTHLEISQCWQVWNNEWLIE